ncbi:unnamed protein product [Victoria cruziana]
MLPFTDQFRNKRFKDISEPIVSRKCLTRDRDWDVLQSASRTKIIDLQGCYEYSRVLPRLFISALRKQKAVLLSSMSSPNLFLWRSVFLALTQ